MRVAPGYEYVVMRKKGAKPALMELPLVLPRKPLKNPQVLGPLDSGEIQGWVTS